MQLFSVLQDEQRFVGAGTRSQPLAGGRIDEEVGRLRGDQHRCLEAEAAGERRDLVEKLTRVDLLVLEDFGMKKLGSNAAEDLLEVFVRRHETASTLITTNRPTQDWGIFLGDVPAATAILDRFLAHATIIQMTGKSYRLRQRATAADD